MASFSTINMVTVDRKNKVAVYWFPTKHRHEHMDNRCVYDDGRGITRCSILEAEAKQFLK